MISMQSSSPSPWRLMRSSFVILKRVPSILIPVAMAHLFKIFMALVIITPLVRGYAQNEFQAGFVEGLKAMGINLYGPRIYLVITLLLFIVYCFSILSHCLVFSTLLNFFRYKPKNFKNDCIHVWCESMPILSVGLMNKTWGIVLRLIATLIRILPDEKQPKKSYNWRISNLFSLLLILDKHQAATIAIKNSKSIMEEKIGQKLRFSLAMLKPSLVMLLFILSPVVIGLEINNTTALWVGAGLSLIAWYLLSLISACIGLIIHVAFYELIVNDQLIEGFNELDLRKGLILSS